MMTELLWWHRVGQKVVCVFAGRWNNPRQFDEPKHNSPYTIREIHVEPNGKVFLKLSELINPMVSWPDGDFDEVSWHAKGFRPLRETSIDCFRQLLNPMPEGVKKAEEVE